MTDDTDIAIRNFEFKSQSVRLNDQGLEAIVYFATDGAGVLTQFWTDIHDKTSGKSWTTPIMEADECKEPV